jgi:hypothetical protein
VGEDSDDREEFRLAIRLSPTEYSRLVVESILNNVTPGELLRQAYFEQ